MFLFDIDDRVHIDGDAAIVGHIQQLLWAAGGASYQVAWMANGDAKEAWIREARLTPAP